MAKKRKKKAKAPSIDGKPGKKDHKSNGRFSKGNRAGIGNPGPSNKKAQKLKDAMLATVSAKNIKDIIKKQIEKAKAGNNESTKIVLDRCLGKPTEIYEVGGIGGEPITVRIVDFGKINDNTK